MTLDISLARTIDIESVFRLLTDHRLPLDGLRDHVATLLVARSGEQVVGSAAVEVYADGALLRSVAVAPAFQGLGLGHELTAAAVRLAEGLDLPALYLLTTTAEQFFPRFGFQRIARTEVPVGVQTSVEFTSACPSSATVMRKSL